MNGPILRRMVLFGMAGSAAIFAIRRLGASAAPPAPPRQDGASPDSRAIRARLVGALPYERVEVPGGEAFARWAQLKGGGRGWPVIVGSDEDLRAIADQFSIDDPTLPGGPAPGTPPPPSPAEILKTAEGLHMPQDLSKWSGAVAEEDLRAPEGVWPANVSGGDDGTGLTVATDVLTNKPYERVHILLIPARHGWEVPAYLRYGNWNACPPAEYHVAMLRDWHARYGAELVGLNGDTMNVRVARQPRDRAAALALAREQYRYCPDVIEQGVESVAALAAGLMHEKWWFFWWD